MYIHEQGSHYYHAHNGLYDMHLFGPILIQSTKYLLLSDFWYESPLALEQRLSSVPFKFIPPPDLILANGFNSILYVEPNSIYTLE